MYYENLNKLISYIEDNLDNTIDFKELAKIVGVNDFILQRIFVFLTDMTLTEYIKKRRLSKAFEELKSTNNKIIDIAIKYQYNSSSSFTRAFKKSFNITPIQCRLDTNKTQYKLYPIINFKNDNSICFDFDYEIKKITEISLYCLHIESDDKQNLQYKIRKLYSSIKNTSIYTTFNEYGMFGILTKDNNKYHYYVGSQKENTELETYTITGGNYAIFKVNSRNQKDIINLEKMIYKQWFSSTNYKLGPNPNFELYKDDYCYVYISIQ